jgi:hypothetical protein
MQMHSYAINSPDAKPSKRMFWHWFTLVWFTSFP